MQATPNGLVEVAAFDTLDGVYDCAWSEANENVLLAAIGDGSIKMYDLAAPPAANPLRRYEILAVSISDAAVGFANTTAAQPCYAMFRFF